MFNIVEKMETPLKLRKVLINNCYGGFGLSDKFIEVYEQKVKEREVESLLKNANRYTRDTVAFRSDPLILEVFEELGSKASSDVYAKLAIREVLESELNFVEIEEYDGLEYIRIDIGDVYKDILLKFLAEHKYDTLVDITDLRKKVGEKEAQLKAYYNRHMKSTA